MKYLRPSLILFVVAFLAYGWLIPHLGFYWDDLPISWIRYQLGPEALIEYFSEKRPVWSVLYLITGSLIPQVPLYWQIFAFLLRWICAVLVYMIVERLWKDRPRLALGVALLYLVYPGFDQHATGYMYSHFYLVIFFLLFSLLCMLRAIETPGRYWVWTSAGLILAALNLWMMEYFFMLELTRVAIILLAIRAEELTPRARLWRVWKLWSPYLVIFVLAVLSRIFISTNQDYPMVVVSQLRSAPVETLQTLIQTILLTLRLVLKDAWVQVSDMPDVAADASVKASYYVVLAAAVLAAAVGFSLLSSPARDRVRKDVLEAGLLLGLGALAVLLAGWPFWLVDFQPSLAWPASRFTMPFALGVSLIFGGLIGLVPWEKLRNVLLILLISLATGKQYLTLQDYRQDWMTQKDLFWQMTWRAPGLAPDTMILLNEGGLKYYADNSLGAALNWIYAPYNHGEHLEYVLFYPKTRLRNVLPKLEPGIPISYDYIPAEFSGNTSQTLAMYFAPPGCLRILDPEVEGVNRLIPESSLMRFSAHLTVPELILSEPRARMPEVYSPEPEHGFCYYFQKADLARQFKDWETVRAMSEIALTFEDHPYDPAEQMVFIEGYAQVGEWDRAVELSGRAHRVSEEIVGRMLCQLWQRVQTETASSVERSEALNEIRTLTGCNL